MEKLTNEKIADIARENKIDPAALLAVKDVESNGGGFLPTGKPKILFEGHIFYRLLTPLLNLARLNQLCKQYPNVVYPTWDRSKYFGGEREYLRLTTAININRAAALKSASWGMFQVMGMNYAQCGCKDIEEFVDKMKSSEEDQLMLTIKFLKNNSLLFYLNNHNWASFARSYNGPSYATNKYDTKLAQAYSKYKDTYK
nr:MAG TPA: N acetylmuramidase [Caudoviricetes sp.]